MSGKAAKWSLRQKSLALFGLVCLLTIGAYWVHDRAQPRYKGRKIASWFDAFTRSRAERMTALQANIVITNGVMMVMNPQVDEKRREELLGKETEAKKALIEMGTNAIPFYIEVLSQRENAFDRWYQSNYGSRLNFAARILPRPRVVDTAHDAVIELATEPGVSSRELRVKIIDLFLTVRTNMLPGTLARYGRRAPFEEEDYMMALDRYLEQKRFAEMLELIWLMPFKSERLRDYLAAAFNRPEEPIKFRALEILERSDYDLRPVEVKFRESLRDSNKEMRYYSARALAKINPMSTETKQAFQAALEDSNEMVVNVARRALGLVVEGEGTMVQGQ